MALPFGAGKRNMAITSLLALFGAGLLTFASPCVLPLLPVYLAVLAGAQVGTGERGSKWRLRLAGLGFSLGLALVFVALGMGASALASTIGRHLRALELGAGVLMLLFGAKQLGLVRSSWLDREARPLLERVPSFGGFGGGLLFGAAFAIGWTPCVGPVLGAALTYAATSRAEPIVAGGMLAVYAAGLAAPLVAASFAASELVAWTKKLRRFTAIAQRGVGAAMLVVGLSLLNGPWSLPSPSVSGVAPCSTGAAACEAKQEGASRPTTETRSLPAGPAIVEFVSEHCAVCEKMRPIVRELEHECEQGLVARISVDDSGGRSIAAQYGVTLVPTFLMVDASGHEVQRIVGEQTKQALMLALSEIRGEACEARL